MRQRGGRAGFAQREEYPVRLYELLHMNRGDFWIANARSNQLTHTHVKLITEEKIAPLNRRFALR